MASITDPGEADRMYDKGEMDMAGKEEQSISSVSAQEVAEHMNDQERIKRLWESRRKSRSSFRLIRLLVKRHESILVGGCP